MSARSRNPLRFDRLVEVVDPQAVDDDAGQPAHRLGQVSDVAGEDHHQLVEVAQGLVDSFDVLGVLSNACWAAARWPVDAALSAVAAQIAAAAGMHG